MSSPRLRIRTSGRGRSSRARLRALFTPSRQVTPSGNRTLSRLRGWSCVNGARRRRGERCENRVWTTSHDDVSTTKATVPLRAVPSLDGRRRLPGAVRPPLDPVAAVHKLAELVLRRHVPTTTSSDEAPGRNTRPVHEGACVHRHGVRWSHHLFCPRFSGRSGSRRRPRVALALVKVLRNVTSHLRWVPPTSSGVVARVRIRGGKDVTLRWTRPEALNILAATCESRIRHQVSPDQSRRTGATSFCHHRPRACVIYTLEERTGLAQPRGRHEEMADSTTHGIARPLEKALPIDLTASTVRASTRTSVRRGNLRGASDGRCASCAGMGGLQGYIHFDTSPPHAESMLLETGAHAAQLLDPA